MTTARAAKVISITAIKAACKDCDLRELCLPLGLDRTDIEALDKLIKRRRILKKGEHLYRLGDPLRALYAVRSGTFKSTALMEDGRSHVTGFYLPGELLGMDAINADIHPCNAEALETAEVCELPFSALEDLAHQIPGLQRQMLKLMSREIVRDEHTLMMLGRMTAEERLASCLVSFGQRSKRLGGDGRKYMLSMSRQDIGDYLGLALETVSRLFTRFREDGLIDVDGRHLRVRDHARLHALATGTAASPHESDQRA